MVFYSFYLILIVGFIRNVCKSEVGVVMNVGLLYYITYSFLQSFEYGFLGSCIIRHSFVSPPSSGCSFCRGGRVRRLLGYVVYHKMSHDRSGIWIVTEGTLCLHILVFPMLKVHWCESVES